MKRILILHFNMELGGAESSLLGLLDTIDYSKYEVDLFLLSHSGEFMPLINDNVNLLPEISSYKALTQPISANLRSGHIGIAFARCYARMRSALSRGALHLSHNYKQYFHKLCMPYLPEIPGVYDLAISFNDPHYIIGKKVNAKVKLAWFHTDASRIQFCDDIEKEMWGMSDYVVNVSEDCKVAFDRSHLFLDVSHSLVIENILSKQMVLKRSVEFNPNKEMVSGMSTVLLSIGRFRRRKISTTYRTSAAAWWRTALTLDGISSATAATNRGSARRLPKPGWKIASSSWARRTTPTPICAPATCMCSPPGMRARPSPSGRHSCWESRL